MKQKQTKKCSFVNEFEIQSNNGIVSMEIARYLPTAKWLAANNCHYLHFIGFFFHFRFTEMENFWWKIKKYRRSKHLIHEFSWKKQKIVSQIRRNKRLWVNWEKQVKSDFLPWISSTRITDPASDSELHWLSLCVHTWPQLTSSSSDVSSMMGSSIALRCEK